MAYFCSIENYAIKLPQSCTYSQPHEASFNFYFWTPLFSIYFICHVVLRSTTFDLKYCHNFQGLYTLVLSENADVGHLFMLVRFCLTMTHWRFRTIVVTQLFIKIRCKIMKHFVYGNNSNFRAAQQNMSETQRKRLHVISKLYGQCINLFYVLKVCNVSFDCREKYITSTMKRSVS